MGWSFHAAASERSFGAQHWRGPQILEQGVVTKVFEERVWKRIVWHVDSRTRVERAVVPPYRFDALTFQVRDVRNPARMKEEGEAEDNTDTHVDHPRAEVDRIAAEGCEAARAEAERMIATTPTRPHLEMGRHSSWDKNNRLDGEMTFAQQVPSASFADSFHALGGAEVAEVAGAVLRRSESTTSIFHDAALRAFSFVFVQLALEQIPDFDGYDVNPELPTPQPRTEQQRAVAKHAYVAVNPTRKKSNTASTLASSRTLSAWLVAASAAA